MSGKPHPEPEFDRYRTFQPRPGRQARADQGRQPPGDPRRRARGVRRAGLRDRHACATSSAAPASSVGHLLQLLPLQGGGVRRPGRRRRAALPPDPAGACAATAALRDLRRAAPSSAYFDFLADEHDATGPRAARPASRIRTCRARPRRWPRCSHEVRDALADVIERGHGPDGRSRLSWPPPASPSPARSATRCWSAGRSTSPAAAEFAVSMILGGLPGLPRLTP